MQQAVWQGRLWLAPDFAILHGQLRATASHAHYAHQWMMSLGAPLTVDVAGQRQTVQQLLIASQQPHAILAAPSPVLTVYAEPLRLSAAALAQAVSSGCTQSIAKTLQAQARASPLDARVQRALDEVDVLLSGKVRADAVAEAAHLSLSQLERLFTAQLGLPVRRLVLWRRLRLAIRLILLGSNLTQAAHAAGFADAAHFSRTMRSLFGVRADHSLRQLQVSVLD